MSNTIPGSISATMSEPYEKTTTTPKPPMLGEWRQTQRCSLFMVAYAIIGTGVLLVVLSILYGTVLPPVMNSQINGKAATCSEDDISKDVYLDPYGDCEDCVPYYYNLYMFNVTNAEDYLEKGDKLKVQELGPYAYRRRELKVDVKLDGDEVSYKQYSYHVFDQDRSCETCLDTDMVTSWNVGYLNVVALTGGELGFVNTLVRGTPWGKKLSDEEVMTLVQTNGSEMMRYANGLNSNQPEVWKDLGRTVLSFFASGVNSIAGLDLSGFAFNGLFATRPVSDYALGAPSLLAGLALGAKYVSDCAPKGGLNDLCASCEGDACLAIRRDCHLCTKAKSVMDNNDAVCASIAKKHAAVYGEEAAETFVSQTCGLCAQLGLCAAALPGAAEISGLDFSKKAPRSDSLGTFIQKTGCNDLDRIGEYVQYNGAKTLPFWAKLDKRRNPTLAELNAFSAYGDCAQKTDNMTCSDVKGSDGTSFPPGGVSITGFHSSVDVDVKQMYLLQAYQNVSLVNTGEVVDDIDGIKMTRFSPPNDLLTHSAANAYMGTGYPVDGVQLLGFRTGFLAYLSYPMFMYGDESLTEGVEITMINGKRASKDTMFSGGELKAEYYDRYHTILDVEAGTGKAMRARKMLMASYALSESTFSPGLAMSDLVWPDLEKYVISPAYMGQELSVISESRIDSYKGIESLLASLLPVLITGIVVGVALVLGGFYCRRRAQYAARREALANVFYS